MESKFARLAAGALAAFGMSTAADAKAQEAPQHDAAESHETHTTNTTGTEGQDPNTTLATNIHQTTTETTRNPNDPFAGFAERLAAGRESSRLAEEQRQESLSQPIDYTPTATSISTCSIVNEGDEQFIELQNGQRVNLIDHFGHQIRPAEDEDDSHQFYVKIDEEWLPVASYVNSQDREGHIIAVPEEYHVVDRGGILSLHRLDEPPEEITMDFTQN